MARSTVAAGALVALATGCATPAAVAQPAASAFAQTSPVRLTVDATDAPRHLTRAHLELPVRPGPLTLAYPKWIPGEHGPTGPLVNLAGLRIMAGDKAIAWRRDSEKIYEFSVTVPPGTSKLDIDLTFLEPSEPHGFSGGASTTAELLDLAWNHLLLYPKGPSPQELVYAARLKLPPGWKFGTALPVAHEEEATIEFAPVTLAMLVDSPVVAGAHVRVVPLGPETGPKHEIDLVADSDEALQMTAQQLAAYRQLVAEAGALFGARHYRDYHFLYTLSDHVPFFGLEHHESSDDRVSERTLLESDRRRVSAGLLPHEFVHSWNGKYRRPRGLATRDYQEPMRGDLLWIYEGLTEYLGWVLTGRSGLLSEVEEREVLAETADRMDSIPGRRWRPLEDTAIAAQILYGAPRAWNSLRRSVDYYPEGLLIWLEADVLVRKQSQGKASLDDFCRRFFGGKDSPPEVRPYDLDEVVRTLNVVSAYDWGAFFEARVMRATEHAPLGGVTGGGYRLIYGEQPNLYTKAREKVQKYLDLSDSLGMVLDEQNEVVDVSPGQPAATAGLAPGMRLLAVDGRRLTPEVLSDAIARHKSGATPLEVLAENGDYFRTLRVDWHGGARHPHLERDASQPDLLAAILAPLTPRPAEAVARPPPKDESEGP
jgi:predicted metalloprotease with PDZ domain